MRYAIWPFYSQHDKGSGRTILDTCGATRHMEFIAKALLERGHRVTIALPNADVDTSQHYVGCDKVYVKVQTDNSVQRIHWDSTAIRHVFDGADTAICNHEYMSIPLRVVYPRIRIVQMCATRPDPIDLFRVAWNRADLVVFHSWTMYKMATQSSTVDASVWPMAYDEERLKPYRTAPRDIDVLFVQRCSGTNYTRHTDFMAAMRDSPRRIVYTDVTKYLRMHFPELEYADDYVDALYRSKVAVALNDDGFGGQAIREAIVCGCIPVVLDAPCYRELCGAEWPYRIRQLDRIRDVVEFALVAGYPPNDMPLRNAISQSYQKSLPQILEDLRA